MKKMFSVLFLCCLVVGVLLLSTGCDDAVTYRGTSVANASDSYKTGNEVEKEEYESIPKGNILSVIKDPSNGASIKLERVVIQYKGILDNQLGIEHCPPPYYQMFYFAFYDATGYIQTCQVREEDWVIKNAGDLIDVRVWTNVCVHGLDAAKAYPPQFQSFPQ